MPAQPPASCCDPNSYAPVVQLNSDLPSLLDEWATSLFRELDYRREARNGLRFQEQYKHLQALPAERCSHTFGTAALRTSDCKCQGRDACAFEEQRRHPNVCPVTCCWHRRLWCRSMLQGLRPALPC